MSNLSNIDDLLVQVEADYVSPNAHKEPLIDVSQRDELTPEPEAEVSEPESEDVPRETINTEEPKEVAPEVEVDDYGNEVPMENAAVRERLSKQARKHEAEMLRLRQEMEELRQKVPSNDNPPANVSDDTNWEAQLEQFIDHRLTTREQQQREIQHRQQAARQQAEFEIKFNEGASKYADFESVVFGKPITPDMVMATQGMTDPAAFIYAAAKTQPQELERISKIANDQVRALELGRLDERMRKARTQTTSAPKPIEAVKGDVAEKKERTWNIDDKLLGEERRMRKERAR